MSRFPSLLAAAAVAAAGMTGPSAAADEKKPAEKKDAPAGPLPAPDWSKYKSVGDPVTGEVVAAGEDGFTLRLSWLAPAGTGGRPGGGNRGGMGHSPQQMMQHMQRQMMQQQKGQQYKPQHQDYALTYADEGMVRLRTLPPRTDDAGKRVAYTLQETEARKQPPNATGYSAGRSDLKVGHIVEVHLVLPKGVSLEKAATTDLRVKYAVIFGLDPNPPTVQGSGKQAAAKKAN